MHIRRAERVSGNAVEFGEGTISHSQGSGGMLAGSSDPNVVKKFKKRRIYQLGVDIPDAGCKRNNTGCDESQARSW